jgi:hypothetical protein
VCFVLPPFSFKFSSLSSSTLYIFFSQITSADIPPPPPKGWIFSNGYRTPLRKPIKNECSGNYTVSALNGGKVTFTSNEVTLYLLMATARYLYVVCIYCIVRYVYNFYFHIIISSCFTIKSWKVLHKFGHNIE